MGLAALQARNTAAAFKKLTNAAAVWSPQNGVAQVTADVIFAQDANAMTLGEVMATGIEYSMTYKVTDFQDLRGNDGVEINGVQYRVRDPEVSNDGRIAVAALGVY